MKRHTYEQEFLGGLLGLAGGAISSLFGGGGGSGGGGGIGGMLQQNDIGGQLISSGIGQINSAMDAKRDWKYYKKQSALDYEYATKMADYNAQIARDQYDYEYEKESPAARRAQYEAAGLNSALMYGAGGQGMQGSVSSPQGSVAHGSMPHRKSSMDGLVAAAQMRQANTQQAIGDSTADRNAAAAELDRERAKTEKRDQLLKDLDVINKQIANERDSEMLDILKQQKAEIIRSIGVENKRKEAETGSFEAASALASARKAYVDAQKAAGLPEAQARQARAAALDHLAKVKAQVYDAQAYRDMQAGLLSGDKSQEIQQEIDILKVKFGVTKVEALNLLETLAQNKIETFTQLYNTELRMAGVNPDDKSVVSHLMRLAWTIGELARYQYDGKSDLPIGEYRELREFMEAVAKEKRK